MNSHSQNRNDSDGARPDSGEIDRYFVAQVGCSLQTLLAPIPGDAPAGIPAAQDENYRRIRHEREEEDPSLPLGAWERELKRADWHAAAQLSAETLAGRSKDLQLAAWLLEAQIARSGFDALAPCLTLIDALFVQYGETLHPRDNDHRINLLSWVGQKLLPSLRRVPITETGGGREYAWNDWEQAQRNEQLRASLGKQRESELEGATLSDVSGALACTPPERIVALLARLAQGLAAIDALEATLDGGAVPDAPGFGMLRDFIERIEVVLSAEARRRGLYQSAPMHETADDDADASHHSAPRTVGSQDRRDVYAALADIAHALEVIEPHSPVPYLIRRAVAWGGLNTAQLYNEVFVRCGGQINIFELLGLAEAGHERQATG